MTKAIPNYKARAYVQRKEHFDGANVYARWHRRSDSLQSKQTIYVVYSYGNHFPLFVYDADADVWVENSDKFSATTSKHRTQLHPLCETLKRPLEDVKLVAAYGICGLLNKE